MRAASTDSAPARRFGVDRIPHRVIGRVGDPDCVVELGTDSAEDGGDHAGQRRRVGPQHDVDGLVGQDADKSGVDGQDAGVGPVRDLVQVDAGPDLQRKVEGQRVVSDFWDL